MRIEVNPMPFTSSSTSSWKSGGGVVPEKFPAGLRVLVVDDDPTCLRILEKMLRNCLYEVTKCSRAEVALKLLRDNKNSFDIVISDVHMPDMDGFKLLEHVGLEMDLPVIMMSADDSTNVVMKGVKHGACDYLIKPVSMEALKIIWQHVVHRKKHEWVDKDMEQSKSAEDGERQQKPSEDVDYSSSGNEGSSKNSNKRKDEEDEDEDRDYKSKSKKPRVVWTKQLQDQFISAVNQIGIDKAVPKKILEVMNVPGLTRENVASHLQKFRLYFRKLSGQVQNGLVNSIVGPTSINGVASSNQFPPRSLSTLQSTPLGRATNRSPVSEPLNVSRNIFAYQNPMIRFAQGQQQQQRHFNSNSEVSLLRGISTNTDSANMPFANMNNGSNSLLTQMIQPQPRHQILNHGIGSNVFMNRPLSSTYTSISQPTTTFSPVSDLGIAALTSNAILQHDLEQEKNVSRGIVPTYDVFDDLNQNRTDGWELEIVEAPQHSNTQSCLDFAPAVLVQPGFQQQQNSSPADNLSGVQNSFFTDDHDDFMNAYLNQNHHDVSSESEFAFDEYRLDNLPM